MAVTVLHGALGRAGAVMGEFGGAETAARFGDVAAEYEALRSGCGAYDLGRRSKLRVSGADRVRWMNGMVTNNVRDLPLNRGVYCFLLNAQGRIQGDMYVYNRGESLMVDTDALQAHKIVETLEKYIIMDDVEITSADDRMTAMGVSGPRARETMERARMGADSLHPLEIRGIRFKEFGISVARSEHENDYEIWMAPAEAEAIWSAMLEAGAVPVGYQALELLRIARGIPRYAQDVDERRLPQETGQQRALNFSKGCYLGQEIVERVNSRAIVHRRFAGFEVKGALPGPGAKIEAGGNTLGEVTSAASLPGPNGGRAVALGYIRSEAAAADGLTIAGAPATIAKLPFEKI